MLFDTVEFLSDQSKIVNPKIEQTLPQTAESTVTLQDVNNAVAAAAIYDIGGFSQGKPDAATAAAVAKKCVENRLLLLTCGSYTNVIRWIPPLIATQSQIDDALAIFNDALAASQ